MWLTCAPTCMLQGSQTLSGCHCHERLETCGQVLDYIKLHLNFQNFQKLKSIFQSKTTFVFRTGSFGFLRIEKVQLWTSKGIKGNQKFRMCRIFKVWSLYTEALTRRIGRFELYVYIYMYNTLSIGTFAKIASKLELLTTRLVKLAPSSRTNQIQSEFS